MRNLARKDSRSPEVQAAAYVFRDAYVLNDWMRDIWVVVPDPPEAEYILSPALMVGCSFFAGDCDDAATLAGSILVAMGIRCQFVAVRVGRDEDFSHVFCRVLGTRPPLDIDPIVPAEHLPIRYTEAMTLEV